MWRGIGAPTAAGSVEDIALSQPGALPARWCSGNAGDPHDIPAASRRYEPIAIHTSSGTIIRQMLNALPEGLPPSMRVGPK
jgi:hypothetical protein